jgi:hypothetical protein
MFNIYSFIFCLFIDIKLSDPYRYCHFFLKVLLVVRRSGPQRAPITYVWSRRISEVVVFSYLS